MKSRKGCISLSKEYFASDEGLKILSEVFSSIGFVTVFIEEDFNNKKYFGYSDRFKEIEIGVKPTNYDVIVEQSRDITNNNTYCINIKEVD